MGVRKKTYADNRKKVEAKIAFAKLNDYRLSSRKFALIADLIRGEKVYNALNKLEFLNKKASEPLRKLLLSAISNWESKFSNLRVDKVDLIVNNLYVNKGKMFKRIQPAPQGRAYKIRKRSCNVYLSVKENSN